MGLVIASETSYDCLALKSGGFGGAGGGGVGVVDVVLVEVDVVVVDDVLESPVELDPLPPALPLAEFAEDEPVAAVPDPVAGAEPVAAAGLLAGLDAAGCAAPLNGSRSRVASIAAPVLF